MKLVNCEIYVKLKYRLHSRGHAKMYASANRKHQEKHFMQDS